MGYLGLKSTFSGAEVLKELPEVPSDSRPTKYPKLEKGQTVFCGYNEGPRERLYICRNLEQMERLYDGYSLGGATKIVWYSGNDPIVILN